MKNKTFLLLKEPQQKALEEALYYMHMEELKDISTKLNLSLKGKKKDLILGILSFLRTGQVHKQISIPVVSKAQKGTLYELKPDTHILLGNFKNDTKTRQFMKTLVGEHFHFTAFGQDWIKERWLEGAPPTYQEFADFWQKEYGRRKKEKASPKQEWAYLSFIKRYLEEFPKASRSKITQQWEKMRKQKVEEVRKILEVVLTT